MVAVNICAWELLGFGSSNAWTEPFLHQDVVNVVAFVSDQLQTAGCRCI